MNSIVFWLIRNKVTGKWIVNAGLQEGSFTDAVIHRSEKQCRRGITMRKRTHQYFQEQAASGRLHEGHSWLTLQAIDLETVRYEVAE